MPSLARRASIMREGGRLCRGNPAGVPLALAAEILQIYPQREAALLSVNLEEKLKAKPYRFRGGRFIEHRQKCRCCRLGLAPGRRKG